MEAVGVYCDEDWNSLSRMFSVEEADFTLKLHGDDGLIFGTSSTCWPTDEANTNEAVVDESLCYFSDTFNPNFYYFSQESGNNSGSNSVSFPTPSYENPQFSDSNLIQITNNMSASMNFCVMDEKNNNSLAQVFQDHYNMEDILCLKEEMGNGELGNVDSQPMAIADPGKELQLKRKFELPELQEAEDDKINIESSEKPKKKSRVSRDAPKNKRNAQSKKNQKLTPNGNSVEETNIAGPNGQSSSCYSSEDDSNASPELNGGATSDSKGSAALNSNGKTRASRGSATDPQSLYARKRRERINERLRILQNLVPNGTKVDISTMLEEAVHYVKFLQLQIKLLSSDDMWMYAPIAYNGMDMGLYQKISPTL